MSNLFKRTNVSSRTITYTPTKTKKKSAQFLSPEMIAKIISLGIGKRQKIVIVSMLMAFGLLITHSTNFIFMRNNMIISLAVCCYFLSLWALWEGLNKTKGIVLMILPVMFTIAVSSFYFLLPIRWLTRLPEVLLYGFLLYSLLLAQNVFNVASIRTIPLYRAASTVSFIFTIITGGLLFAVVIALNLPFYLNALLIFLITYLLAIQSLWTISMENINTKILVYAGIVALLMGEAAAALSFWPFVPQLWGISLSAFLYVSLGIIWDYMKDRFEKVSLILYSGVAAAIVAASILVNLWILT